MVHSNKYWSTRFQCYKVLLQPEQMLKLLPIRKMHTDVFVPLK